MATKPKNKITAWSYSRYSTYSKCPYKLKCSAILRIKEPANAAMERGTAIHKKGEHYMLGDIRGVPPEYKLFSTEMKTVKKLGGIPEADLSVTKNYEGTTGDDWDHVWLRAKADVDVPHPDINEATEIDFKTGRYYPTHIEQGEIYAICKHAHEPTLKAIDIEFWYLDSGDIQDFRYTAADVMKLRKKWERQTKKMLADTRFIPTPSSECNRCYYSRKKNGPCKY